MSHDSRHDTVEYFDVPEYEIVGDCLRHGPDAPQHPIDGGLRCVRCFPVQHEPWPHACPVCDAPTAYRDTACTACVIRAGGAYRRAVA